MSKFPLPPNYFRCPKLNAKETARLNELGERTAADMVHASRLHRGSISWTIDSNDNGLRIYSGEDPSAPPSVTTYCAVTEIFASLEETTELFKTESAAERREYLRMFCSDQIDSHVLYNLSAIDVNKPSTQKHLGIKWMATEMGGIVKNRDWCFLEGQHAFKVDGRTGWVLSHKSVKLSCCPEMQNTFGVIRGDFHRSGFIFFESERPGYLVAMLLYQIDWKGQLPQWYISTATRKRCRVIGKLDQYVREKRLSGHVFLPMHQLIPVSTRTKCFVCCRKFGAFSRREQCRKCGEVVCRSCSKQWNVGTHKELLQVRVCNACSVTEHPSTHNKSQNKLEQTNTQVSFYTEQSQDTSFGKLRRQASFEFDRAPRDPPQTTPARYAQRTEFPPTTPTYSINIRKYSSPTPHLDITTQSQQKHRNHFVVKQM